MILQVEEGLRVSLLKLYQINKFQFLSGIWNSMPNKNFNDPKNNEISNYYFNPVIIHLAGIRRRDRVEFIKKYKNLFI